MIASIKLYFYCGILLSPFLFIIYALSRFRRHWSDGKEQRRRIYSKSLIAKFILSGSMIIVSILQGLTELDYEYELYDIRIVKIVLFSSFTASWVMSLSMVIFENYMRLRMKWCGHRSYWPFNFVIYVVLFILEVCSQNGEISEYFYNYNLVLDFVGIIECFGLTILALCKPNEFDKNKDEVSANLIKRARVSVGIRNSMPEDKGLAGAVLVSIKDYKIKVENNKKIVLYNITIKIKGEVYKIRRTYNDFDKLYKSIKKSFPIEIFPYMVFPQFPVFTNMNFTMEEKTLYLNDFLVSLCCPEFMLEETLNFLNIQGPFREKLLEEHEEVLETEKGLQVPEDGEGSYTKSFISSQKVSIFEKSSKTHTNLHVYFQVKISIPESVSNKKIYRLTWTAPGITDHTILDKRYKDFTHLNSVLKKTLSPAILPKFPSKSYVQNLRKADAQGTEIRRRKLEKYISHILNDPGFQCQDILDFIDCKLDINQIWEKKFNVEYDLSSPVGWEGELDGTSSYIVYILNFSKFFNQEKVSEWTVKRTFEDFTYFENFLAKRMKSPQLIKYFKIHSEKIEDWPKFSAKNPTSLSNPNEIEVCRKEIEFYIEQLCQTPFINQAYAFKAFIDDSDSNF